MRILVLNGPNLNLLGLREPEIYGTKTYKDLENTIMGYCKEKGVEVEIFQTNHEGDLIDEIQDAYTEYDGIVLNAAAYTHTSIGILDALKAVGIPAVEVHLTDLDKREDFRQLSYPSKAAIGRCMGKGFDSYLEAIDLLEKHIESTDPQK